MDAASSDINKEQDIQCLQADGLDGEEIASENLLLVIAHKLLPTADFLSVIDITFRQLYAFFIIELGSRCVVYFGAARHPTDAWVAQQLRVATHFDEYPVYVIRDNYSKFGDQFTRVAAGIGIKILKPPYRAPKADAFCEWFLVSVRRECLDHFFILSERQLPTILKEYAYFNHQRPHQGLDQRIPVPLLMNCVVSLVTGRVVRSIPIVQSLHHCYQLVA